MNRSHIALRALLSGILLLLGANPATHAGPGDLDVRFGTHGQVEIPGQIDGAALIALSDGAILVFGVSPDAATRDSGAIAVARLRADGSADPTFAAGGHKDVALGSEARPVPTDALPLPDGQALVAGYFAAATGPNEPGWLVRLSRDGEIDPTFGLGGVARAGPLGIRRFVVLADGAVVVSSAGLLSRLDPNGAPVVFPGTEKSVVPIGNYPASAMVETQDGGVLFSGYSDWGGLDLYRVSQSGTPQPGWGLHAANVFTEIRGFARDAHSPAITVCGSWFGTELMVQRWQDDGTPDPAFAAGTDGRVRLGIELRADFRSEYWSEVHCGGILAGPSGNHVVIGDSNKPYEWGGGRVLLAHLDSSGALDHAFDPSNQGRRLGLGRPDEWSRWYVIDTASAADGAALLLARRLSSPPADASSDEGTTHTVLARVEVSTSHTSPGSIGFNDAAVRIAERTPGEVRVYRTGGSAGSVSVRYQLLPGTASAADVDLPSGTLTWADGDAAPKAIRLAPVDDDATEGEENFHLQLSAPAGGAALGVPEIEVTIEDDEALAALSFAQSTLEVREGSQVDFTITRPAPTAGPVLVRYAWAADLDPQGTPRPRDGARIQRRPVGELRWSGDDTSSRTVSVFAGGYGGVQPDETGYLVLADVAGTLFESGGWKVARAKIVDDPALDQSGGDNGGGGGGVGGGGGEAVGGGSGGGGACSPELLWLLALMWLFALRRRAAGLRPGDATPRAVPARCGGAAAPARPVPESAGCS